MAQLEPYEKVLVDSDFIDDDVHGQISCEQCHGGDPESDDYETAHEGLMRDPSYPDPVQKCGECHFVDDEEGHPEIAEKNKTNLHVTLAPFKNKIYLRANADPSVREKIDCAMETHCMKCHSSCGQCHVSRPNSVEGGFVEGHIFQKTPPVETNCTSCHGSRVGKEFYGQNKGVQGDVHRMDKCMSCMDCHSGDEMHGNGMNHETFDRYDVADGSRCEKCHKLAGSEDEAAQDESEAKERVHPSHMIHKDKVSCQVCHAMPYKHCYSCHVGKDASGAPYFKTKPSKVGFKIGMNPKMSEDRPEQYVTVRHIPVSPDLFDFYVKDALTEVGKVQTWKYATPHSIQLKTPQNETCLSCHGKDELFLTEKDAAESWEIDANKDVFVTLKPAPSVRHNWLEQPKLHLKKTDCLVCHDPSMAAPVDDCQLCHTYNTILLKEAEGKPDYSLANWKFTNAGLIEKGNYVVGSNRIPALDVVVILLALLTLVGCAVHGALRFTGKRRK